MITFQFLNLPAALDTSSNNFTTDFFEPLLSHAKQYDRAVGFFRSGWLRLNAKGIVTFAKNGGHARWLTSPILDKMDWEALLAGEMARMDSMMRDVLKRHIKGLTNTLKQDTRLALRWLIANDILSFKLAVPRNKLEGGDFHDKFGLFTDAEGNQVSFNGSYNDSIRGMRNYESLKTFVSWEPAFAPLVQADAERFERLWNNMDPNIRVYDLSEAAHEQIVTLQTDEYPDIEQKSVKVRQIRESSVGYYPAQPTVPSHITLRNYQIEAIEAWFEHECQGLLEMATGTGKTITALAATVRLFKRENRLVVVIACPFRHLVTQWTQVVEQFGFNTVATVNRRAWVDQIANEILDFSAGYIDNLVILTTHNTFSSQKFVQLIQTKKVPLLLIVDEVHDVGAPKRRRGLLHFYRYRLGLSATPKRWFDEEGTERLFDYFGDKVFEFPLVKAIPEFLTPYEYYPYFVELTDEELEEYQELTKRIIKRTHTTNNADSDQLLALYLILRQKIIKNAENKYRCFEQILNSLLQLDHTLVYCSAEQIERVQAILNAHRVVQSRFTGQESLQERSRLLDSFDQGRHQVLVAMKCLDQGVDVPSTRTAILLASSGNPKEFIQRRGRVLRRFEGKKKARIYDIIVVPTLQGTITQETFELERKILEREIQRYDEFAALSLTRIHALNQIGPIKRKYLVR